MAMSIREARFWFTLGFHYNGVEDENEVADCVDDVGFNDLYRAWSGAFDSFDWTDTRKWLDGQS